MLLKHWGLGKLSVQHPSARMNSRRQVPDAASVKSVEVQMGLAPGGSLSDEIRSSERTLLSSAPAQLSSSSHQSQHCVREKKALLQRMVKFAKLHISAATGSTSMVPECTPLAASRFKKAHTGLKPSSNTTISDTYSFLPEVKVGAPI